MELSRYRIWLQALGLALVAMMAAGAITSSVASAVIPEFNPFPTKFTTKSGSGQLESSTGEKIECSADQGTGEITGEETVGKVVVVFTGCTARKTAEPAKSKASARQTPAKS